MRVICSCCISCSFDTSQTNRVITQLFQNVNVVARRLPNCQQYRAGTMIFFPYLFPLKSQAEKQNMFTLNKTTGRPHIS